MRHHARTPRAVTHRAVCSTGNPGTARVGWRLTEGTLSEPHHDFHNNFRIAGSATIRRPRRQSTTHTVRSDNDEEVSGTTSVGNPPAG